MNKQVEKLGFGKKIIYAIGQFGWCLASYAVFNLINYFYMPPESTQELMFPPFIFQGAVIFSVTIIGIITFGGRIFDAITDPIIAGLSDRSRSKFGRRRKFMLIGSIPFAITSVLIFIPIVPKESVINVVWLGSLMVLFYLFFTVYVTPYYALISELGHTPQERLTLSTIIAITWALGFMAGSQAYIFQGLFESVGFSPTMALQSVVVIFAVVGLVCMLLPVIFIDESRYCEHHVSKEGSFEAVRTALKDKNFLFFALSDLMYFLALTIIQVGISYYVIVLLELPKDQASIYMLVLFLTSFVFYVPVNLITKVIGKKNMLVSAFVLFGIGYILVAVMGNGISFIPKVVQGYILMVWCAIPMAIFGILPNAIVADIAEANGIETGNYKAGVFFGARGLVNKFGVSIANLIFPSFLLLGKSVDNDIGVRISAISALIFCIIGMALFMMYNEKKVLKTLAKKEDLTTTEIMEIQDDGQ